jgi:hypothetical protein
MENFNSLLKAQVIEGASLSDMPDVQMILVQEALWQITVIADNGNRLIRSGVTLITWIFHG